MEATQATTPLAEQLQEQIKGDVFTDVLHRAAYSTDASIYRVLPVCVVAPRDAADVAAVVRYAAGRGIAVAPRGAASGLAGESLCGGIVLDMARYMNRILGVEDDGAVVVCEPGAVLDDVNRYLAKWGRKIGPDPSSGNRATIGGCVANNATGMHSLLYGHTGDHVERMEAVLADGTVVEFGNDVDPSAMPDGRAKAVAAACLALLTEKADVIAAGSPKTTRDRSGYNIRRARRGGRIGMARLLAGSEGTLAVFTKVAIRTVATPAVRGLLQMEFASFEAMGKAVPLVVATGPGACEMVDDRMVEMAHEGLPEYRDILPAGAKAVLLIEHTGADAKEVEAKIRRTDEAVGGLASGRRVFLSEAEQKRIWQSRKDAGPLLYRRRTHKHPAEFMEDVCVPAEDLGTYIAGLEQIADKYGFTMSLFGHAGDGELHVRPDLDLHDPKELRKMQRIAEEVFTLAWSLGGSISGEHADGLVRSAYIRRQFGDAYYEVLRSLKAVFDPAGLLNPGKILNDDPDVMIKNLRAQRRVEPERVRGGLLFGDEELELELEQCYGCGVCLNRDPGLRMCPVYRAMGEEMGSSRAKANLLHVWATGQLSDEEARSPEFRKFLDLCVNCKACARECPSGVDVSRLMAMARAQYVRNVGLRRTEGVLAKNRYLSMAGSVFGPVANVMMRLGAFRWAMEKMMGIDRRRMMPAFWWQPFLRVGRKYVRSLGAVVQPADKVAYFIDSYANYNDHELGFAVIDVLRACGVEVVLPDQRPAPLPAIVYGDVKTAREDLTYSVRSLARVVRDGYKVVCSEPSAALALKEEMPHFVSGADAELVRAHTYELMSYLLGLFNEGKTPACAAAGRGNAYVYHLPCHLAAVGGRGASIELLRRWCGIEVTDLRAGCCGLAGTFGMQKKNYDLSEAISGSLRQALARHEGKTVLTECAACKMQIEHLGATVRHPVKVVAEMCGDLDRGAR